MNYKQKAQEYLERYGFDGPGWAKSNYVLGIRQFANFLSRQEKECGFCCKEVNKYWEIHAKPPEPKEKIEKFYVLDMNSFESLKIEEKLGYLALHIRKLEIYFNKLHGHE